MQLLVWGVVLIILCVVVVAGIRKYFQKKQQLRYEDVRRDSIAWNDPLSTIFVSIPCYEDEQECAQTLFDLFNKAKCPWRLTAGVLHHCAPTDNLGTALYTTNISNLYSQLCTAHHATDFTDRIRFLVAPTAAAWGPMAARARIEQELFHQERYYMTVDSHMRFVQDWDALLLHMYDTCLTYSAKPILTTFPGNYDRLTGLPTSTRTTYVAVQGLDADGFPMPMAQYHADGAVVQLFPSLFWVPCFSFASSRLIQDVPMDPGYAFLFYPEMYLQSARYWTHGWDFYTPNLTLAYHCVDRSYRPNFWDQIREQGVPALRQRARALKRALVLLSSTSTNSTPNPADSAFAADPSVANVSFADSVTDPSANNSAATDLYSLGHSRSLKAFQHYCGVTLGAEPTNLAKAGCTPTATDAEFVAKFGTSPHKFK